MRFRHPGAQALLLLIASMFLSCSICTAEEAPKKAFFLPKSATAAAYVLGRLTNDELIAAPRSEFVYVALLQRSGLERKYRLEALDGLAKIRGTDPPHELIAGIGELDKKGESAEPALRDLGTLLLLRNESALAPLRSELAKLQTAGNLPITRQLGWAALVTIDRSPEKSWKEAQVSPGLLSDLLLSLTWVRDEQIRASFYPGIIPLLQHEQEQVRHAAIIAIAAVPGHEVERFTLLAGLVKSGNDRPTAITSLQGIPRSAWPASGAEPLLESLLPYLQSLPVDARATPEGVSVFQFATDLSALVAPATANAANQTLRSLGVAVIAIRTIKDQMLFDKTLIAVEPGKPLVLLLINEDVMPHNLVVVAPGSLEEVGEAAEKMPPTPDDQGRLYIPNLTKVLHGTKLVEAGQQGRLSFVAPEIPGEYQYVCTFPGHWRRMAGTLAIVKDPEAYLAAHANSQPKMTEWKLEDLVPEFTNPGSGRNAMAGKELFTKLACKQCHKIASDGYAYGPDLTEVFKRWKEDRASVLEQILEPSKVIEERYRPVQLETTDGDEFTAMVLKEDAETLTVQTGASDKLIRTLKKSEVSKQMPQKTSLMPLGLLNSLSKNQIMDLLFFLETGGSAPGEHVHSH
jgi:putative heme-binding domain-containing protein